MAGGLFENCAGEANCGHQEGRPVLLEHKRCDEEGARAQAAPVQAAETAKVVPVPRPPVAM